MNKCGKGRPVAWGAWRAPATWFSLLIGIAFLVGACGGGNGAPDDIYTSMDTSKEDEAVDDFELVVFGTENYTKGQRIRLSGVGWQ